MSKLSKLSFFNYFIPILSLVILIITRHSLQANYWIFILAATFLGFSVMSAVHHAEIIAHKIGEGLGTLVLAISVTVIEVGLILALMGKDGGSASFLARDTVFAAVMIVTNGIVAICLMLGGLKFKEQEFQVQGSKSLLVVLIALSFLVFVLPNFTTSTSGPTYNNLQMIFIGAFSLILYMLFIFFQTTSHKSYFEPTTGVINVQEILGKEITKKEAWLSFISLCVSLIAVVGFAKRISPNIEQIVVFLGAPKSVVGVLIAGIVLLPESWSAVTSARANRLQTSLNLALGSGIASIALTIPSVIVYSIIKKLPLNLGLDNKNLAFMLLTFLVSTTTLGSGKSTLLQGAVHAVILLTYFVVSFIP
ncbi:MAG: hypothetical protein U0T83_06235 [Bacteriovoracaceae bacterium]